MPVCHWRIWDNTGRDRRAWAHPDTVVDTRRATTRFSSPTPAGPHAHARSDERTPDLLHLRDRFGRARARSAATTTPRRKAFAGFRQDDGPASHQYTQEQADAATKAALEATGGGSANSVETDNENGATYEVEVTKLDGSTVDVRLDENY